MISLENLRVEHHILWTGLIDRVKPFQTWRSGFILLDLCGLQQNVTTVTPCRSIGAIGVDWWYCRRKVKQGDNLKQLTILPLSDYPTMETEVSYLDPLLYPTLLSDVMFVSRLIIRLPTTTATTSNNSQNGYHIFHTSRIIPSLQLVI